MARRDERARELVEQGALLLDVRTPPEFASGHLPGAVNVPLDQLAGHSLDDEHPVVVYCRSGARSHQAAQHLRGRGLTVHDMGPKSAWEGGIQWSSYVLPLAICLTLGLAPFTPEPHIVGKIRWVAGGAHGMALIDWGDLLLHGAPWVWLAVKAVRDAMP